jgi:hypothetical protein
LDRGAKRQSYKANKATKRQSEKASLTLTNYIEYNTLMPMLSCQLLDLKAYALVLSSSSAERNRRTTSQK